MKCYYSVEWDFLRTRIHRSFGSDRMLLWVMPGSSEKPSSGHFDVLRVWDHHALFLADGGLFQRLVARYSCSFSPVEAFPWPGCFTLDGSQKRGRLTAYEYHPSLGFLKRAVRSLTQYLVLI
jgi:hypothetical protein